MLLQYGTKNNTKIKMAKLKKGNNSFDFKILKLQL